MSQLLAVAQTGFFADEAVRVALALGTVVAIVAGTVGVFTVMRGQSFAGEALGDLGATGGSGAFLLGVGPLWGFLAMGIAAAGAMELIGIQRPRGRDLATGIVLGAGLGLAALFLYWDATRHNTTGATITILFGSVFAISSSTFPLVAILSVLALGIVLALYRPLLLSTVSAEMAAARGVPVRLVGAAYLLALAILGCPCGRDDRGDPQHCAADRPGGQCAAPDQETGPRDAGGGGDRSRGCVGGSGAGV